MARAAATTRGRRRIAAATETSLCRLLGIAAAPKDAG
jgi:hypothetical protein